ncbi:MAG: ABC transporter permease [Myxococcales bacterium]|nr:ABC transporter permease [Myxococcales bacterium]
MFAELIKKREVLDVLVQKDFKARYKDKALGRFWSLADPLVMVIVFTIVFEYIFKTGQPYFPIFLLLGLTPYRFFTNSVNAAAGSGLDNAQLVKKVAFPRIILPFASVLSHMRHFFIELLLVLGLFLYFPAAFHLSINLLWLPLVFALQCLFIQSVAMIVAALNVRYRDTQYMLNSVLLILYWMTPLFYSFSIVPRKLALFLQWNPMVGVVEGYRAILLKGAPPSFQLLGVAAITSTLLLFIGTYVFKKYEKLFADYL